MARKLTVEESLQTSIAKKLSNLLYERQITQKEFADRVGVSAPTVSAWCNGTKSPRLDKIDKICEVLSITRADLLNNTTQPKESVVFPVGAITMEDIQLAQKINRLDEYRKRLIQSIINSDPEQTKEG